MPARRTTSSSYGFCVTEQYAPRFMHTFPPFVQLQFFNIEKSVVLFGAALLSLYLCKVFLEIRKEGIYATRFKDRRV